MHQINEEMNDPATSIDCARPAHKELLIDQSALVEVRHGKEHRISRVLLDTGADYSFVSRTKANEMGLEVMPTLEKLTMLDGSFEATAFTKLTLRLPEIGVRGIRIVALVHTLRAPFDLVIGRRDMYRHELLEKSLKRQRKLVRLDRLEPTWARKTGFVGVSIGNRTKGEFGNRVLPSLPADLVDSEQKSGDKKDQEENRALANELYKDRKTTSSSISDSSTRRSTTFDRVSRTTSTTAPSTTSNYSKCN